MTAPPSANDQKFWAKLEATFDTVQRFVSTDAVSLLDLKLEPDQPYRRSKEHTGSAGLVDEFKGKAKHKWSASAYVAPNAAGVEPDVGAMLKAAMGAVAIVADTSVTYSFNSLAPPTLQLARAIGTDAYEVATGAWVEQFTAEVQGDAEAKFTWSGGFATYGWVWAGGLSTATIAAAATTFTLKAASRGKVGVNGAIKIGTDDNSGVGYLVTGYNPTTGVVTFAPALANEQTGEVPIYGFTVGSTLSGTILSGVDCGLSFDGGSTSLGMNSCKLTVKTGFHGLDKEATASKTTGVARGTREAMFESDAYFDAASNAVWLGKALDGLVAGKVAGDANILARIGSNTAAARCKIVAPKARVNAKPLNVPDAEEVLIALNATPRKNSVADDELTLVLD